MFSLCGVALAGLPECAKTKRMSSLTSGRVRGRFKSLILSQYLQKKNCRNGETERALRSQAVHSPDFTDKGTKERLNVTLVKALLKAHPLSPVCHVDTMLRSFTGGTRTWGLCN